MSRRRRRVSVLLAALAGAAAMLAGSGMASAHVTISPASAPRGTDDLVLVFRVPNEQPHANVVGLRVLIPTDHPIAQLSPESTPGWTVTTKSKLLAHPVKTDDGTFTTAVSEIDWTGGSIPPGQFGQFSVLAQGLPDDIGQLAFNTLQVYSNGQTVAWIEQASKGNPDPQHPAPILTLTATGSAPAGSSATTTSTQAAAGVTTTASSGGDTNWLGVVALIAAGFAATLALMVLWLNRPSMRPTPDPTDGQ